MRTRVDLVLHRVRGVFEYAIHRAYVSEADEWAYESGRYYDSFAEASKQYEQLLRKGLGA